MLNHWQNCIKKYNKVPPNLNILFNFFSDLIKLYFWLKPNQKLIKSKHNFKTKIQIIQNYI